MDNNIKDKLHIITAGAGSGKTTYITNLIIERINQGLVKPESIIATTFTKKAAREIQERIQKTLIEDNKIEIATQMESAWIGTIHSIAYRIIKSFAKEIDLSPDIRIIDQDTETEILNHEIEKIIFQDSNHAIFRLSSRFTNLDWKEDIRNLILKRNETQTDQKNLKDIKIENEKRYKEIIKPSSQPPDNLDNKLKTSIEDTIIQINEIDKEKLKKGTIDAYLLLDEAQQRLRTEKMLPWSLWKKLATQPKVQQANALMLPVSHVAQHLGNHPQLQEDLLHVCRLVFDIADKAGHAFNDYKRQRGLLSFNDIEVLAIQLLSKEAIRKQLAHRTHLFVVDELQDTSPSQLSFFKILAQISKEAIWVGDAKQAIYEFRGTHPHLMESLLEDAGETSSLEFCYRSRPQLVRLTKALFSKAFGPSTHLPEPGNPHDSPELGPSVELWELHPPKNKSRANNTTDIHALIEGVKQLLNSTQTKVRDGDQIRAVQKKDIAILCPRNSMCRRIAEACEQVHNLPVVVPRSGLMKTPEGTIILQGLKLFLDPHNRLAQAIIARLLHYPHNPDLWLEKACEKDAKHSPFFECPEISRLVAVAKRTPAADTHTAFSLVLKSLRLLSFCRRWPRSHVHLDNVEQIYGHLAHYVASATAKGLPNTPDGLVQFFEKLIEEEKDTIHMPLSYESITISTFHSAKGLEWPITILFGYNRVKELKTTGVLVSYDPDKTKYASSATIHYQPWPFKNFSTEIQNRFYKTEYGKEIQKRSKDENIREIYVAWTRARDRLILAARHDQIFSGYLGLLDPPETLAPQDNNLRWGELDIPVEYRKLEDLSPYEDIAPQTQDESAQDFPTPPNPQASGHPPLFIAPSSDIDEPGIAHTPIVISKGIHIHHPIHRRSHQALGNAIHHFFSTDNIRSTKKHRYDQAYDILTMWGVRQATDIDSLLACSARFQCYLHKKFPGAEWEKDMPLFFKQSDGSIIRGEADIILKWCDNYIIIDHKIWVSLNSTEHDKEKNIKKASSYWGQLYAYKQAIEKATKINVTACFLHLATHGWLVPVHGKQEKNEKNNDPLQLSFSSTDPSII